MAENEHEDKARELALIAARAMDEKKGTDIVIQHVGELLDVTDYFVICTAANNRRVDAIADEVREKLREQGGVSPLSTEGLEDSKWVLIDYGSIVVHIFQPKEREYYRLEQLWDEASTVDVAEAGIDDAVYSERIATLLGRELPQDAQ
ncbi:MAG: ribosome silencing factor [Coriobacteriales bacterium]